MTKQKQKTLVGLKKAQSLLGKIVDMIEGKEYCIDIMQQNLAVIGLLKAANQQLMEGHLKTCFSRAMKSSNQKLKNKMIEEILRVEKLSNK